MTQIEGLYNCNLYVINDLNNSTAQNGTPSTIQHPIIQQKAESIFKDQNQKCSIITVVSTISLNIALKPN